MSRASIRRWLMRAMSKTHTAVQRLSRGRALGRVAGMPVLLLTTTGRRSGKPRTRPLTFFRDGADLAIVASNGRADRPPDWSLNLQENPRAVVRIGIDEFARHRADGLGRGATSDSGRVTAFEGPTRATPYHQTKTPRRIPVIISRSPSRFGPS